MKKPDKISLHRMGDKNNGMTDAVLFGVSWWSNAGSATVYVYFLIWNLEFAWYT